MATNKLGPRKKKLPFQYPYEVFWKQIGIFEYITQIYFVMFYCHGCSIQFQQYNEKLGQLGISS